MRLRSLLLIAALAAPTVSLATSAFADKDKDKEQVVKLSDIPVPAQETIRREAQGAPILKVETEQEHGQIFYEGHVKRGAEEIGIVVDSEGALIGTHSEAGENE